MPAPLRLLSAQHSFLTDLHQLEEPLLIWLEHTARHDRTAPDDAWRLPAGLDGEAPRTALINIHRALPKPLRQEMYALDDGRAVRDGNRVVGFGGSVLTALYAVPVDPADIDVLAGLLDHFHRALSRQDGYASLHGLLEEAGDWYGCEYGTARETPADVVDRLARTVAVLRIDDEDTRMLVEAVTAAGPGGRITLTTPQEAAAIRYLDLVATLTRTSTSPLDRALARLLEPGERNG
ncbi:hypothetical protein [Streptomyces sp. NPDC057939]|uniref:hypothetical protein n=1 Tax=Streptomyces sp. NPDC057939 TaxID=3346284 RepID=UPI0036E2A47A